MAKPPTMRGTKMRLLQGDGATPTEAFTAYCALTTKSFKFTSQSSDIYVPDCTDPEAPAWRDVIKSGRALDVTASGTMDKSARVRYEAAYNDDEPVNYRLEFDVADAVNGGYWSAAFHLTDWEITGDDGDLTKVSLTLKSSGPVTWVDTP